MSDKLYICPKCLATYNRKGKCSNCGEGILRDFDSYTEEEWEKLVIESEKGR